FIPEEGAAMWVDSFAVPKEAPNPEGAHQFLDFICRADVAGMNSNFLWCASANREARKFLSEEVLAEETLYPGEETLKKCELDSQSGVGRNRLVNRGMKLVYDSIQTNREKEGEAQRTADAGNRDRAGESNQTEE
ncbi:MAG: ABC transporter substrate-binding protein, partial [Verrucomicrobiae bacterium]|nr:ABC transporter substrate-binding protein [Verrucomicrobiae bacterium]